MSRIDQFNFTAFTGADLLADGATSLSCGDTFSMPVAASATLTVLDDDPKLSGDARRNELGDDKRSQTADVRIDGEIAHEGVGVYAEETCYLRDEAGNRYVLVEVEIAGASGTDRDDFYAFHGDVPPIGAELTVHDARNVKGSKLSYDKLSAGLDWSADAVGRILVEAEDMALDRYKTAFIDAASGGEAVKLAKKNGEASLIFGAADGVYDVEIAYLETRHGDGEIRVELNGVLIETIAVEGLPKGAKKGDETVASFMLDNLTLATGDVLSLSGQRDGKDYVHVDALTFTANRAPTGDDLALAGVEDEALSGQLIGADLDGDDFTFSLAEGPLNGVATVGPDGAFTYTPEADFNGADGFTFLVTDVNGATSTATVSLDLEAVNDAPTLATGAFEADEDGAVFAFDLAPLGGDVDADESGATLDYALTIGPALGAAEIDGTTLLFSPGADFHDLGVGDVRAVDLVVIATDKGGEAATATMTVTVVGANDAPEVAAVLTAQAAEDDAPLTVDLLAGATDVDAGAALGVARLSALPPGFSISGSTLTLDPAGAAFQSLNVGDEHTFEITYDVADEHGAAAPQTLAVSVTGTNDGPTGAAALTARAAEDEGTFTVDLLAGAADVDAGAVLSVAGLSALPAGLSLTGAVLTVDPADAAFQSLGVGDRREIEIAYQIVDEHGAAVAQTLTVTVEGANDGPRVAEALTARAVEDGAPVAVDLLAGASDADAGAVLSVAGLSALPAGFSLAGSVLTLDPADAAFQSLALGETRAFEITYDVVDEHGAAVAQSLTMTVEGNNDAPTVAAALTARAPENDPALAIDLLAGAADADAGAVLGVANLSALPAGFSVSGATLTVDPSDAAFQSLGIGDRREIEVTFDVVDEHGAAAAQTLTVTIDGANDGPTVAAPLTARVSEDDAPLTIDLLAGASDVDTGAVLSVANLVEVNGRGGRTAADGAVTIDPNAFNDLNQGEQGALAFTFDVVDQHGAAAAQTLDVTVDGVNDLPELTIDVAAGASAQEFVVTFDVAPNAADAVSLVFTGGGDAATHTWFDGGAILRNEAGEPLNEIGGGAQFFETFEGPRTFVLRYDETPINVQAGREEIISATARGFQNGAEIGFVNASADIEIRRSTSIDGQRAVITSLDQSMWAEGEAAIIEFNEYLPILGGPKEVLTLQSAAVVEGPGQVSALDGIVRYTPPVNGFANLGVGETQDILLEYAFINQDGATVVVADKITATGGFAFTEFSAEHGVFDAATGVVAIEAIDAVDVSQLLLDPLVIGGRELVNSAVQIDQSVVVDPLLAGLDAAKADADATVQRAEETLAEIVATRDSQANTTRLVTELAAARLAREAERVAADLATEAFDAVLGTFNDLQAALDFAQSAAQAPVDARDAAEARLAVVEAEITATGADIFTNPGLIAEKEGLILALNTTLRPAAFIAGQAVSVALNELENFRAQTFDALSAAKDAALAELQRFDGIVAALEFELVAHDPGFATTPITPDLVADEAFKLTEREAAVFAANAELTGARILQNAAGLAVATARERAPEFDLAAELVVDAAISGQLGVQLDFVLDAGSVDTQVAYDLTAANHYNVTTDMLDIQLLARNVVNAETTPFATVSPNMQVFAGLLYDLAAEVDVFFDATATVGGLSLFDLSPGGEGVRLTETIELAGKLDILDIDTRPGGSVAKGEIISDVLEYDINAPSITTIGQAATYEQFGADESGLVSIGLDKLIQEFADNLISVLSLGDEFRAYLNQNSILVNDLDALLATGDPLAAQAILDAVGAVFTSGLGSAQGLRDLFSGDLDTDGDGRVPLIVFDLTPVKSTSELIHLNTIPSFAGVPVTGGEFGFFAAFEESDPIVELSVDFDDLLAKILNKAVGNVTDIKINPFDLDLSLGEIFEITSVPQNIADKIRDFVDLGLVFELADIDFGVNLDASQQFSLSVDDMAFDIVLENGESFRFIASETDRITIADASSHDANGDGVVEYDIALDPTGFFTNDTEIGLGLSYAIDFLNASLLADVKLSFGALELDEFVNNSGIGAALDALGIAFEVGDANVAVDRTGVILNLADYDIGPLIEYRGDLDALRADIYEDRFAFDLGTSTAFSGAVQVSDTLV